MSKSIWQQNGILPIEFCSIHRAAEILKCRIDDLLHLGEIGAIELCVLLNGLPSSLMLRGFPRVKEFDKRKVLEKLHSIIGTSNEFIVFDVKNTFTKFEIEKEVIGTFRHPQGHGERIALLSGRAVGLWALTYQDLHYLIRKGEHNIKTLYPENHLAFQSATGIYPIMSIKEMLAPNLNDKNDYINMVVDDLILSRNTIDKIYEAMLSGRQLPNFANGGLTGERLTNHIARGSIGLSKHIENNTHDSIDVNDCLHLIGAIVYSLKNTTISSKRWTQDFLKSEILDKGDKIKGRKLDDLFSLANKLYKSMH